MINVYNYLPNYQQGLKKTLKFGLELADFLVLVYREFGLAPWQKICLVTTDRTVVDHDKFKELQDNSTLYLLQSKDQDLQVAAEEAINFVPHYNTLIESGTFEYFAEGQKSLPCSLAELVDNSLSATAKNTGVRTIEIRLLFDKTFAVVVLDNGCGMTSKQLNNWAVYRLSKFTRENSTFESEREGYTRPEPVRRSLNSDISYFGVGGKQAAFHIGNSVRMITKPRNSPDVHELVLSKDEFEKKEKNKEDVYKGTILNRKPGDFSHITHEERYLQDIIKEETRKESFTAVVITGVCPDHIKYLKDDFHEWTRRLAHIYHYYIHGVDGNHKTDQSQKSDVSPKIDILVTLREKPPKGLRQKNLREVQDDLQTLYINSAVDTFEFKATTSDGGSLDGILRYHPFLYDKETYPKDPIAPQAAVEEDDDENQSGTMNQARGKRDIFECFWNGRLIPYTTISEFDWCRWPNKSTLPLECFSRFSGVLFTNDKFRVNASKQKFMDLELKLRHKDTHFTPVFNVQKASKNRNIQKEFMQWLEKCHSQFDKQVKFLGYSKTVTRTDVPTKKLQHPWAVFSAIELDGKTYKAGDLVKSQRTQPIYYGKVNTFFLYGDHEGNVFATGGEVEITRVPEALYDNYTRTIPISKIDRSATIESIKRNIETDIDKLPEKLCVTWPEGNALPQNAVISAGTPLGPLAVEILNRNDKSISSRIQTGVQGGGIKLNVGLKIFLRGAKEVKQPKQICHFRAPYVPVHGHWFKKIGSLTNLGNYTLTLQAEVSDNANNKAITSYGGRQLPSYEHKFTVKEGNAENFTIGPLNPSLRIGVPFSIPTQMTDIYGHPTKPPPNLQPVLECSDLEVSFETTATSGNSFTIKGVKVIGEVQNYQQTKRFDLKVTLPGLKNQTQTIKISPFPSNPHSLLVKPEVKPVKVENGNPASFNVEVHDEAGNITANAKQIVRCQIPGLKLAVTDCSSSGTGQIVTEPINLKIINGEPQMLQAKFDMPSQKHVVAVTTELKVMPSCRVSRMELFCEGEERLELKNKEKIQWQAGGVLENLFFKLYDESGKEVEVTPEIASNIKVNWTGDFDQRALIMGRLPDVQVPTKVKEERFHQVSYRDHSVSFSFTIVPCPDEPARLKATVPENTVKLGECVTTPIKLKLVDQYDNVTNSLTSDCVTSMAVEAEGLDKSNIAFIWEESSGSIKVSGVRFNSGPLGTREVCFICGDYTEQINFKVTAGIPTKLKLLSGPEMPLQILNGTGISTPFVVQLCDKWGNPSPDQRVVVETRASPSTVKVTTSVTSQPVDAEGKAAFTVTSVKGLKGYYQLEFVGCFNRKPIPGPHVNFNIIPDPNKPDKLSVNYDTSARFLAGGTFPVFSVAVLSDAGSAMTAFKSADLSMWYWSGESMTRPETATMLMCSKPMENDNKSRYYFRDKKIPQSVGTYTIQFSLKIEKTEVVFSNQIIVNVVANQPVKLGPECQPQIPVVSYSRDIANRTLVENMTLKIMDQYGNPTGQNLNGKVLVSIKCPDGEQSRNLPVLEVASTVEINLKDGSTHIERLAIRENSPGENGRKYILIFKPEVVMPPTSLSPFELPFHFYDDSENQRKVSELTKKKDELTDNYEKLNNKCSVLARLRELHTKNVLDANKKEEALKRGLEERGIPVLQPSSIQNIDSLLQQNADEKKTIEDINRRVFPLPNRSGPDILGMVGHLAHISNDKAAWVISWHLSSEMDCVITKTTAEAQRIFHSEHGRQQVMALDSIYVNPRSQGPLPHIKNGRELFSPVGNPLYARNLLIYTTEEESCERVFKNILGNTILMDDIESATNYRKAVIEKGSYCPTILTLDGNRLSASGKFGGAQNKAPHEERVKKFGAPLPQRYQDLQKERELLIQFRSALEKKKDEDDKRNNTILKLSETRQQKEETKAELQEIERQLASVRSGKRGPEDISEPSGLMIKRPRRRSRDLPEMF
ncbi:PREDICTED: structural maintenance of chromosomes flexible hinge domain-containing protein 1-like isoform X3 [Poecilia mexicana]|uniref:structural maintenance of chromosomes flexible hinge domain-containing protein 1-like isoform X3 n=1 Tax=Poecilia mexicana TaxID=48701 RepID=UPI00072EE78A|nr:PREDICTED: structural maintenance of chromosomes flexible hinge domain-containing protein 1-like isoform X3 [Poecilia mexicana]